MEPGLAIDLTLALNFGEQDGAPLDYVVTALSELGSVAYKQELEDFKIVRQHLDHFGIDAVVMDAVETRLRAYKNRSVLRVRAVNDGSVEIAVAVTGLFVWLLDKTLGETIKEAFTSTRTHERLREFLMNRREAKAKELGSKAAELINKKLGDEASAHIVLIDPLGGPGHHRYKIRIEVELSGLIEYPPPLEDLFSSSSDKDSSRRGGA